MFSTACNSPNLSALEEAQTYVESAKSILIETSRDIVQETFIADLISKLDQACSKISLFKKTLVSDLKVFELKLKQNHEEYKVRMKMKRQRLVKQQESLIKEK